MLSPVSIPLVILIAVLVAAVCTAVYVVVSSQQRREVLLRVEGAGSQSLASPLLRPNTKTPGARLAEWVAAHAPASWSDSEASAEKLVQAGFDGRTAPALFAAVRAVWGLLVPAAVFVWVSGNADRNVLVYVGIAAAIGVLGPPAVLDRLVQRRQTRLRRAVPDALDLLVVCVEAGVSLDAAVLRVARDLGVTHPELAGELAMVNRKVNAGMPREQALQGLWTRTGLEELRGLVASMVQSERWGTSIAKVLRVNAETLRRVRKQTAEKKAAQASLKMMGPMVLFMLPALFIVLLGPAFMRISEAFATAGQ
jgi:tight adherence protein C